MSGEVESSSPTRTCTNSGIYSVFRSYGITGPGQSTHTQSQNGFLEPNCVWVDAPASSGSIQFLDETKAIRPAPFPIALRVAAATFLTGGLAA